MNRTQSLKPYQCGGSRNFERGSEDNVSAPSSFIANAHYELHAFCTEKGDLLKKLKATIKGALQRPSSLNPPLAPHFLCIDSYNL